MNAAPIQNGAEWNYLLLRVALDAFDKPPHELNDSERSKADNQVKVALAIQEKVLKSKEASDVSVPESVLDDAVATIVKRYESHEDFLKAMEHNGMSEQSLREAIKRELMVDAIITRLSGEASEVTDAEIEIYYLEHQEKFDIQEARLTRHILITINDEYEGNDRDSAKQRIDAIAQSLHESPEQFPDLAKKHSECPTSLEGGLMGKVIPGKLFPELESVLYDMDEGETSDVVESPVGFHILKCDAVEPARRIPLHEVRDKIRGFLSDRKQKRFMRSWLSDTSS